VHKVFLAEGKKPTKGQVATALKKQTTKLMELLGSAGRMAYKDSGISFGLQPFDFDAAFKEGGERGGGSAAKLSLVEAAQGGKGTDNPVSAGEMKSSEEGAASEEGALTTVGQEVSSQATTSRAFGAYGGGLKLEIQPVEQNF
jgi:hypothetical protein